jgi:hypothetical protein
VGTAELENANKKRKMRLRLSTKTVSKFKKFIVFTKKFNLQNLDCFQRKL